MKTKFQLKDYFSKDLVKYLLPILFSGLTYCCLKYYDYQQIIAQKNISFNNSNDIIITKLKLNIEILKFIDGMDSLHRIRTNKIGVIVWSLTAKEDTLKNNQLKKILSTTSNMKYEITMDIAKLKKYEGLNTNDGYIDNYKSQLNLLNAEKKFVDQLENHTIFLKNNGLNASNEEIYKETENSMLNLYGQYHEELERQKYAIKYPNIRKNKSSNDRKNFANDISSLNHFKLLYAIGIILCMYLIHIILYYSIEWNIFKNPIE